MGLTVALLIVGFAWMYGKMEPYVTDFVGASAVETSPPESNAGGPGKTVDTPTPKPTEEAAADDTPTPEATSTGQPDGGPTISSMATPTESFNPSLVSNPSFTVNLRPGPSVNSGDPLASVDPSTPLEATGKTGQDEEGSTWIEVKLQSGLVGWLRQIDTSES